jgi:pimeloyl-ACP methyl ester carboxylesterase
MRRHNGAMSSSTSRTRVPAHVVLVPGFWLGAWAWDEVVAHLHEYGVAALALTLPGLEAYHPDRGSVRLEDHVAAIEQALARAPQGARTVLVAHSGATVPATFRERAVPQPAFSMRDAVSLADDRRLDVPGTMVCTAFSAADYRSYAEQGMPFLQGLLQHRQLELVDLATGHWPMWSKPAELADIIGQAAAGQA